MLRFVSVCMLVMAVVFNGLLIYEDGSGRIFDIQYCLPWAICAEGE